MFNVGEYRVYFKHYPQETGVVPYPYSREVGSDLEYKGRSECYIVKISEPEIPIALGQAYCSLNDNFSRFGGRYVSFTRAVYCLEPKELRQHIWNEFRKLGGV